MGGPTCADRAGCGYSASTARNPSSTARRSAVTSRPTAAPNNRPLSIARTWSHTANDPAPADGVGTMRGGLGRGPVESGTTITVRRARFRASADKITAGRVF